MSDIQGLLAKMETVDDAAGKKHVAQEIKQRIAIVQRGVGGITKGQAVTYTLSDGKKIQKVTEVVTGTESVVRAVSFLHQIAFIVCNAVQRMAHSTKHLRNLDSGRFTFLLVLRLAPCHSPGLIVHELLPIRNAQSRGEIKAKALAHYYESEATAGRA